jgi:hypothetical protein
MLLGSIIGAAIVWEVCDSGRCWTNTAIASQPATAPPTATTTQPSLAASSPNATSTERVLPSCSPPASPTPSPTAPANDNEIVGLAIIGDSTADEYRADDQRGGEFGDTTFNWVELLVRERNTNVGVWGSRPEPRRSGYEFNWARSGATSQTMLNDGQHTGVARQIADGQVSHVIIQIGINDFYFNDVAFRIYRGELEGEELTAFLDSVIANVEVAVQTVTADPDAFVMLTAIPDYLTPRLLPELSSAFSDVEEMQRIIDAIAYLNRGLVAVADRTNVAFFDFNAALQQVIAQRTDPSDERFILVGGQRIDTTTRGDEPTHVLVDDDFAHPGTVFSGLIANMFIDAMNASFGTEFERFADEEILRVAGIQ